MVALHMKVRALNNTDLSGGAKPAGRFFFSHIKRLTGDSMGFRQFKHKHHKHKTGWLFTARNNEESKGELIPLPTTTKKGC